jgi:uncharacterized protein
VKKNFTDKPKKPFHSLFGGEAARNSPKQRAIIDYMSAAAKEGYELAASPTAMILPRSDILKRAKIKESRYASTAARRARRPPARRKKKGTFDNVLAVIDAAVKTASRQPAPVVELEISGLVKMAEFLDAKGWLDLPQELFKTQLGRNTSCSTLLQPAPDDTVRTVGEYSALSKAYPVLEKFHRPDFKGIRHMVDTGELYMASFDTCPAAKTEWVFDLNGEIYGCTASCGRREYRLGTFYPVVTLDTQAVEKRRRRSVKTLEKV